MFLSFLPSRLFVLSPEVCYIWINHVSLEFSLTTAYSGGISSHLLYQHRYYHLSENFRDDLDHLGHIWDLASEVEFRQETDQILLADDNFDDGASDKGDKTPLFSVPPYVDCPSILRKPTSYAADHIQPSRSLRGLIESVRTGPAQETIQE